MYAKMYSRFDLCEGLLDPLDVSRGAHTSPGVHLATLHDSFLINPHDPSAPSWSGKCAGPVSPLNGCKISKTRARLKAPRQRPVRRVDNCQVVQSARAECVRGRVGGVFKLHPSGLFVSIVEYL